MPAFWRGRKDKSVDHIDPVTLPRPGSSSSRGLPRHRGEISEDPREAVTATEPHVGSTRKDRSKHDDWDGVYDDSRRRKPNTIHDSYGKLKLPGGFSLRLLRETSRPQRSHDHRSIRTNHQSSKERSFLAPRSSRENNVRERDDPRGSRDQHSSSHRRSRERDSSPQRSEERRHRRRRKSSHPKELSRHRSSNNRVDEGDIPATPPAPPLAGTPAIDRENQKRLAEEYEEKTSKNFAASQTKKATEDEMTQKLRNRLTKQGEEDVDGEGRREDASVSRDGTTSELNRRFGEPTRTYLEGMVPDEEFEMAKRKQREEMREEAKRREGESG